MIKKIIKIFIVCVLTIVFFFLFDYKIGAKILGDNKDYSFGFSAGYSVHTSRITGLNYVKRSICGFAGCDTNFYIDRKDYSKDSKLRITYK